MNPSQQQNNWENNVYVLSTTRILLALGLTVLIRSLYQLFQRMRSAGGNASASVAGAEEAVDVDLEALALGALGDAAIFCPDPVNGISETIEITFPPSTYSPQGRSSLHPVSPRQEN